MGLKSCWEFLRDLFPVCLVDDVPLRGWREGEPSREVAGDCATELAAEDCFELVWLAAVALFGGGNDGAFGPVVLLALMLVLGWTALSVPSTAVEGLSIVRRESCVGVAVNEVKKGDWIRRKKTMSSWVARHGRSTSSDATGDTRVGKLGHDAQGKASCVVVVGGLLLLAGVRAVVVKRKREMGTESVVLSCKPGAEVVWCELNIQARGIATATGIGWLSAAQSAASAGRNVQDRQNGGWTLARARARVRARAKQDVKTGSK